jgi:subtilisin family serine protease
LDIAHEGHRAQSLREPGEIDGDGIDNDGNGLRGRRQRVGFLQRRPSVVDNNGHGTHVAGIRGRGGQQRRRLSSGVIQTAKILPIKIATAAHGMVVRTPRSRPALPGRHEASLYQQWWHARREQSSWPTAASAGTISVRPPFRRAIHDAAEAGILVVIAAGQQLVEQRRRV